MSKTLYALKQDVKYAESPEGYFLLSKGNIVSEVRRHGDYLVIVRCGRGLWYEAGDDTPKAQFGFYEDDLLLSVDILEKIED